jgi:hypothetical protein
MSKTSTESFRDAIENLTKARDEVRLSIHLLSMEGKKKWDELERKVEQRVTEEADKVTEVTASKTQELARTVRKFVEQHVHKA